MADRSHLEGSPAPTSFGEQIQARVAVKTAKKQPWKDIFEVKELLEKQNGGRCVSGEVRLQRERDQHVFLGG
jgi:hypothetical protein